MAKTKKAEPLPAGIEQIERVNLVNCLSQSLSRDQQHILLVFTVGDPVDVDRQRKFGVTLPAAQAKWLTSVAYSAAAMVERAGKDPGNSVVNIPVSYAVASDPKLDAAELTVHGTPEAKFPPNKGKLVVGFDQGRPSEMNFVMMNGPAMALAEAIRQNVAPRLTAEEKAELRTHKVPV